MPYHQTLPHHPTSHSPLLTDSPLPTIHPPRSFHSPCQVSSLLQPYSEQPHSFQSQTTHNPITLSSDTFIIPKPHDSFSKGKLSKVSSEHEKWLEANKRFARPYAQCTRFVDCLAENRTLLRRGQFGMSVGGKDLRQGKQQKQGKYGKQELIKYNTQDLSRQYTSNTNSNTQPKYTNPNNLSRVKSVSTSSTGTYTNPSYKPSFLTKHSIISKSLLNLQPFTSLPPPTKPHASKSINLFDRSVSTLTNTYHTLMKKQRVHDQEDVMIRNSVSKLVAADLVRKKLENDSMANRNNLKKIQQVFRKGSRQVEKVYTEQC